ncbi:MAG: tRNA (N6-isopentenyl adenosine(37)-C2)-methylthiotransferase MiaB [Anaerolineaceae bacterium]|nr:tRNA (N6-isopentenyl adenosine(37)-C2)-methylthiotransferase MiaB [Anaerolineaceae bacterium]
MKYHIWTEGCQMNTADSQRLASAFEALGLEAAEKVENADVVILNTCMVRQSAEDRALGRLGSLKPVRAKNPDMIIGLMGCMVGYKDPKPLKKKLPFVDVFAPPSNPKPIVDYVISRLLTNENRSSDTANFEWNSGEIILPKQQQGTAVSAYVPVVYGCSHACAYCIIPYKRGAERSRDPEEILAHARSLAAQGVKEITLLGQIIDRYGLDRPDYPKLPELLRRIHDIEGVERIRFLTSHPNWMTDELLKTVAGLPRVLSHIEVPAQSGSDAVLETMRRGYTDAQYRDLIAKIRDTIPNVSIGTDIIVGFCGESEAQFEETVRHLEDLRLNVVHLARYSPRTGTLSERTMADDVSDEEKWRRFRVIEKLQEEIARDYHEKLLEQTVPVLFEERKHGRWLGRTENMDLVFAESDENLIGKTLPVRINWASPWTMGGEIIKGS